MEVSSSSGRIEKFSGRPGSISLREFKATFSTVVCELELKYGANFTNAFAFKQLARYVHYEALDVYEQHSQRILGVTQVPNPAYAAAIATASQAALQAAIAQHGTVVNNPAPVPTSVALSPQQLATATATIPPTIDSSTFSDPVGEFFRILELEFPVKSSEKILQLATFSRQKGETLKMLYRRLLKLKDDTQSITDLEAAHRYLRSLEGTPDLHSQVLQRVFSELGDTYTLLDVYNIAERLELAHAYYDASNMRPVSRARPQPPPATPTRASHTSSRTKSAHLAAPILPSCNYCGNPDHKAHECNIPSEELFCDFCGKEGHQEAVCFAKFPERKQLRQPRQNLQQPAAAPPPKGKAAQPSSQGILTKSNFSKGSKKKEYQAAKKEVLQAQATQVQSLQSEIEGLRAQLATLKGKSTQPATHAQPVQGSGSGEGPPRSFYGLPLDSMVGECVRAEVQPAGLTAEFSTSFCPSYFAAQQASAAPRVSSTRKVVQTDGLASHSGPMTRARQARAVIPKGFKPLDLEEERSYLARGEENASSSSPSAAPPTHSREPRVFLHQEDAHQSSDQQHQCHISSTMAQKLFTTPLFSFRDLKLSKKDVVAMLGSDLEDISGPILAPVFYNTEVPSQVLDGQSSTSRFADSVRNLATSSSTANLADSFTSEIISTHQRGGNGDSIVDLLFSKGVVDSHSLHKVSHSFPKVVPSERTSIATGVAIVDNTSSAIQVGGCTPRVVLLDTGAQPVILGVDFAKKMGLLDSKLRKSMWQIRTASGSVEEVLGESSDLISLTFNGGTDQELHLKLRCLVTNATSYDVLVGQEALFPPGFTIDNWFEHAYYRVDWETEGHHLGYIPLDLHGSHTPMAHHCMLKEVHTISYIRQASHEWIEEDEEEIAYAQAAETFRASPTDIQHGPEVLKRLKAAHEPLVKAMSKFESMESHGEPIRPLLRKLVTWTPPKEGLTLLELFGGISTGLEALLQSGMVVQRYFYVDIDPLARKVAESRMIDLTTRFPQQFPISAWKASFSFFPSDIQLIQRRHMELLGPLDLIIAGWECQGFSAAGVGEGLGDARSGLFVDMVQVITWAQEIAPNLGYIIENTPSQFDQREKVQEHFSLVQHYLGAPLLLDAVQCGSYAHRLRNLWTNLAPLSILELALKYTIRDPNIQVSQILDDQSSCQPVTRQEKAPWFPANVIGEPRGAWPTLVSFPGAHAFQNDGPGLVY